MGLTVKIFEKNYFCPLFSPIFFEKGYFDSLTMTPANVSKKHVSCAIDNGNDKVNHTKSDKDRKSVKIVENDESEKNKKCVKIVEIEPEEDEDSDDDQEHRHNLIRTMRRRLSLPVQKGLFRHSFRMNRSHSIVDNNIRR